MEKFIAWFLSTFVAMSCAVPVFAMEGNVGATMEMKAAKKNVDIACVQTAVDKREDALITGWSAFHASISGAYSARKTALHDAWGMTDAAARKAAVKMAWGNFKKSAKTGRKTWKDARKSVWKTFRSEVKSCKGATADVSVELSGEAADDD